MPGTAPLTRFTPSPPGRAGDLTRFGRTLLDGRMLPAEQSAETRTTVSADRSGPGQRSAVGGR
ncbi:hypothetical protein SLNWT_6847 [Streptomyces albus]|uniref:Uncharacterized protein n=1 Tax=Streptomyces albus (strain ATCC 21838 / DSM 41398 / FERM P-419 / JCM 4703 / NBRC 107858) TaxID=1081613 RepID=A0A0B5EWN6_STRA4|nr:hypothetical protein SLNWT_6847 [Streptomyces albus]AYN37220.1 hypothetical protein DUI70_6727 [Streptomyces albus]